MYFFFLFYKSMFILMYKNPFHIYLSVHSPNHCIIIFFFFFGRLRDIIKNYYLHLVKYEQNSAHVWKQIKHHRDGFIKTYTNWYISSGIEIVIMLICSCIFKEEISVINKSFEYMYCWLFFFHYIN